MELNVSIINLVTSSNNESISSDSINCPCLRKTTGDDMSLKAEVLPNVKTSSAPAYWSAQCGDKTYAASYTLMMDWDKCKDYCTYFPHSVELGFTFSFADILDVDTMECLRYNMNSQYTPGNGYDGHYWAGGYRGGDGQYRWDSGAQFTYDDFVDNRAHKDSEIEFYVARTKTGGGREMTSCNWSMSKY